MTKGKYIPHLAEMRFRPKYNWSKKDAYKLYLLFEKPYYNQVHYKDCNKFMDTIEENSIDCIIADPPFGIEFSGKESYYNRDSKRIQKGYHEIDEKNYYEFSKKWIDKLPRIMKETASAWIISGYTNLEYVLKAIRKANLKLINHIILKTAFSPFCSKKWVSSHYHILFIVKNEKKYFFHNISHYNLDIWDDIPKEYHHKKEINGTKLPVKLLERILDFTTRPGDLVYDPFFGNGTTGVACRLNYRHYLGTEINKNMKEIIENNINQSKLGKNYIPYWERIPTPEELSKIDASYMRAYKAYMEEIDNRRNGNV